VGEDARLGTPGGLWLQVSADGTREGSENTWHSAWRKDEEMRTGRSRREDCLGFQGSRAEENTMEGSEVGERISGGYFIVYENIRVNHFDCKGGRYYSYMQKVRHRI